MDLHTAYGPYAKLQQKDGIHPTAKGAEKLAELVMAVLQEKR
jgi:lysophospholipase L1-like esterase